MSKPLSDADLLRSVLAAGFWSNDGVCHYCGEFDVKYKTHYSSCLAKSLIAWAQANKIEIEDADNVFPDAPEHVSLALNLTPPVPMTEEEKIQAAARAQEMAAGLGRMKDAFNRHATGSHGSYTGEPGQIVVTDEYKEIVRSNLPISDQEAERIESGAASALHKFINGENQ